MFDPCGTRKLEGDEILKRLAAYLGVSESDLKDRLYRDAMEMHDLKNTP